MTSTQPNNLDAIVEDVNNQLPPLPSNLPAPHKDFLHCKPPHDVTYRKYSLFLAGSIEMGGAIQWQPHLATLLQDLPITVCNPRRGAWNSDTIPSAADADFRAQVLWELGALEAASVICFFFDETTRSPVTMLELGLWAHSSKVVVCCSKRFWKSGNVHIVCRRYGIPYVETFEDLVPLVRETLAVKGLRVNGDGDLVDAAGKLARNERDAQELMDAEAAAAAKLKAGADEKEESALERARAVLRAMKEASETC